MASETQNYESETKPGDKEDKDLLIKMDKMFRYALDHPTWVEGRKRMLKCFQYKEGDQWSAEELAELAKRGQPDTVNNLVAVTINKLVGDLVDQKIRIGFRGRNSALDTPTAELLSDIFLYIRQSNALDFEERDMGEDGFTCGFGVMDVNITFDDLNQPEIKVKNEDSLLVFPDPDSRRYDWNEDAKFIARAKWLNSDEAKEKWPKATPNIVDLVGNPSSAGPLSAAGGQLGSIDSFRNDTYVDAKKSMVRIIEVEYKKYSREQIVLFEDGRILTEEEATTEILKEATKNKVAYEKIDRITTKICCGSYCAGTLLEHKVTRNKLFSLVPYFVYRRKTGEPYSLVTLALSLQDAINKRESKALHLLNSNQVLGERAALGDKEELAAQIAMPDGVVVFEDGALSNNKVILRNNLELSQFQFQMHAAAQQDFYRTTGVNPNTYQQTGEIRSGAGLKQKFQEANKPILPIFDNFRRTRHILGRVLLERVQNYWTSEKTFLVTDNPQSERTVTIDASAAQKIKTGAYDVVIEELADTTNVQQEQYAMFTQYLPQILPFGPFWVKKLIQLSEMRDKDALIKELDQMSGPPPVVPRISVQASIDQLSPPERAFFYKAMGDAELGQVVMQMKIPTTTETKGQVDLASQQRQLAETRMTLEHEAAAQKRDHLVELTEKKKEKSNEDEA